MINFKLAELRKLNHQTQQELGAALGVSHKTISRWENGSTLPDISVLPQISAYFGVSVDALLGLVPLEAAYTPSGSGAAEYWEKRLPYLQKTRKILWNEDYLRFLIRDVWKLQEPVSILDCGCGYGYLALMFLPLLPEGSRYMGIDFSPTMIQAAGAWSQTEEWQGKVRFAVADIQEFKSNEKYDLVVSQAVLRHVNDGADFLKKMVAFLKPGGLLVSMECNREFEADGLYIRGMEYADLCRPEGLRKLWKTELEQQNRDYAIAMKIPHYMKDLGLQNVASRMNDRVTFLEPEQPDYGEILESVVRADRWGDPKTQQDTENEIAYFMNHGMSRGEAEDYVRQQNQIVTYLRKHAGEVALTKTNGIVVSYGWKARPYMRAL